MIKVIEYNTYSGKIPFREWLETLDLAERVIIRTRLNRILLGNFGDFKLIKGAKNIFELRINYGPSYRIYLGKKNNTIVLLLIGGTKRMQKQDIEKAKEYWNDYQETE